MTNYNKAFEHDNVNGVTLCLKVDIRKGSPKSKHFTITYKSKENKSSWPKLSLFFAVLFNIVALFYVRISVTIFMVIVIVISILVLFWVTHCVQSESVLVIPTVGIQSSIKYVLGREDNFVPWTSIDDVIINEVIKLNRVLYFLTLLVKNNQSSQESEAVRLIPLFKYTKPRLVMLEKIYSEVQELLVQQSHREAATMGSGDIG